MAMGNVTDMGVATLCFAGCTVLSAIGAGCDCFIMPLVLSRHVQVRAHHASCAFTASAS